MHDPAPAFSVIVPLYDCEHYVEECLESLKAQTFPGFEAIVVNDASPDDSLAIAKRVAGGDGRFRFFEMPENRGLAAVRNRGLDEARGGIVVFLDSDDLLVPCALEHMERRFREQDLDDLYFNAESFYEDAKARKMLVENFSGRDSFEGVASGTELFTFFENRGQFFIHGALRAVRRSLIEAGHIRFPEGIIHEDVLFTFQTLLASRRSSFLNEPVYRRRIHAGSIMAKPRRTVRNIEGHLVGIDFMRSYLVEHATDLDPSFVEAMAHRLNVFLDLCARDWMGDIADDEKEAFLAGLDAADRARFQIEVAQRAEMLRDFYGSTTWRVGQAMVALPQAVRDKLASALRKRGSR